MENVVGLELLSSTLDLIAESYFLRICARNNLVVVPRI